MLIRTKLGSMFPKQPLRAERVNFCPCALATTLRQCHLRTCNKLEHVISALSLQEIKPETFQTPNKLKIKDMLENEQEKATQLANELKCVHSWYRQQ